MKESSVTDKGSKYLRILPNSILLPTTVLSTYKQLWFLIGMYQLTQIFFNISFQIRGEVGILVHFLHDEVANVRLNFKEMLCCGPIIISALCLEKPPGNGCKVFGRLSNPNLQRGTFNWIGTNFFKKQICDDIFDFGNVF